ncbi:DnaB-like helicase N-terminal domain-containing protein [Streptomyces sp. DG2A-72]|uniref:DnaB-like helicase N-terminal domain-containing protein n=1 Tax=Streptomyces sp. DG2A-72 TaxID=3051386 RepID=UPI00265B72F6|nr:DnaB-like helicase N-terminal domain-containing protein [Streptomyces sp. DG2A-72]MDO0936399.1 DnaB-like helicase N-terminal domain-containing protein [Streptomyces sp. DG2A-72]
MPHTPDPDEDEDDDVDLVPAPKPVHYAEQALLGALLLEPTRLADTGTLAAGHFDNHSHASLFSAIRALAPPDPDDHAKDVTWLNAVLEHARPHAPGLTASYLHALIQFCPQPKHAAAYTRMIRSDHARRTLRLHAERLAQTATDTAGPDPAANALAQADALGRVLDDLAGQFAPHPGSLPRTAHPANAARQAVEEDLDEERLLLATATAYPAEVQQMRWLAAEDFLLPLHAALWQSVTALVHRGDMIDPVTVLGEAQHRGLLTDSITPRDLMALISTPAGSPEYWGEKILQRALLARAHTVAQRITAYTDDPANTPHQLITGSRRALADLNALRARWNRATTPAPSPTTSAPARSAPLPRAGPPHRPTVTAGRTHR